MRPRRFASVDVRWRGGHHRGCLEEFPDLSQSFWKEPVDVGVDLLGFAVKDLPETAMRTRRCPPVSRGATSDTQFDELRAKPVELGLVIGIELVGQFTQGLRRFVISSPGLVPLAAGGSDGRPGQATPSVGVRV